MAGWNADTAAGPLGAGTVTLVEGSSFCISSANGDLQPEYPHGVFFEDTCILSRWNLTVNGEPLESLAARTQEPYRALFVGRGRCSDGYADSPLIVERLREEGAGILEQLTVRNYSPTPVECVVSLKVEADFADPFRYGFIAEAQRIATALLEAAEYSEGRLPELFCGFSREHFDEPVPYPTACWPQAWAATTPHHAGQEPNGLLRRRCPRRPLDESSAPGFLRRPAHNQRPHGQRPDDHRHLRCHRHHPGAARGHGVPARISPLGGRPRGTGQKARKGLAGSTRRQ